MPGLLTDGRPAVLQANSVPAAYWTLALVELPHNQSLVQDIRCEAGELLGATGGSRVDKMVLVRPPCPAYDEPSRLRVTARPALDAATSRRIKPHGACLRLCCVPAGIALSWVVVRLGSRHCLRRATISTRDPAPPRATHLSSTYAMSDWLRYQGP